MRIQANAMLSAQVWKPYFSPVVEMYTLVSVVLFIHNRKQVYNARDQLISAKRSLWLCSSVKNSLQQKRTSVENVWLGSWNNRLKLPPFACDKKLCGTFWPSNLFLHLSLKWRRTVKKCSLRKMVLVKFYSKPLLRKIFVLWTKMPLWLVKGKFT